jgi:hypothetical protein
MAVRVPERPFSVIGEDASFADVYHAKYSVRAGRQKTLVWPRGTVYWVAFPGSSLAV